jgi:hypothetical protein
VAEQDQVFSWMSGDAVLPAPFIESATFCPPIEKKTARPLSQKSRANFLLLLP